MAMIRLELVSPTSQHSGHFVGGVEYQKNVSQVACAVRDVLFMCQLDYETIYTATYKCFGDESIVITYGCNNAIIVLPYLMTSFLTA